MAKECSNTSCGKSSCEGCSSRPKQPADLKTPPNANSHIRHVIGVASGKGGVGKSLVTAALANRMAAKGLRAGILDADITGPSIPRMYGITQPAQSSESGGILPAETENNIKVMSVNLLLPSQDTPVIWRGPILANMVKQFWGDVVWGDLDILFVDMPPGTGDVPLTVFQSLPVDGIVIVSSPQDLVQMIVRKAYNMAQMMHISVLGLVENYSYVRCPDCKRPIYVFGKSRIDDIAADLEVPVIGRLPLDPQIAQAVDAGRFAKVQVEGLEMADAILLD